MRSDEVSAEPRRRRVARPWGCAMSGCGSDAVACAVLSTGSERSVCGRHAIALNMDGVVVALRKLG